MIIKGKDKKNLPIVLFPALREISKLKLPFERV